jgi:hypothetical protein
MSRIPRTDLSTRGATLRPRPSGRPGCLLLWSSATPAVAAPCASVHRSSAQSMLGIHVACANNTMTMC